MKTRLAPILAALSLGAAGCVDNMGSVQIFEICAFPDDCVFTPTCTNGHMGDIALDLSSQQALALALQVNNQRSAPTPPAVDTAVAYVEEFTVTYDAPSGLVVPGTSGQLVGTVPTGGSTTLLVEPITAEVGAALVPQVATLTTIVAKVRLKGKYADQSTFETAEYKIPVQLCKGCVGPPAAFCTVGQTVSICPPGAAGQLPRAVSCK